MTIERRIAGKARELVSAQEQKTDAKHEDETSYRSLCESLPNLLRTAGLAQTTAFLKAKSEDHKKVYEHLDMQIRELGLLNATETLLSKSTDSGLTTAQYRILLEMTMMVAFWHKRMAQALLRKSGEK